MLVLRVSVMLARVLLLTALSALFSFVAVARDSYCAFEVTVRTPSGDPISKIPVALIQARATTFSETATDASGIARLCDAPLEYMDIIVGRDICGSVMVRHLAPTWPDMRPVYVTYVDAPCDHFGVAPCAFRMREGVP
jgi:hypothetical protein